MKSTLNPETGLVHVEFDWSPEHGSCYECGLPAAYAVSGPDDHDTPHQPNRLRCSVCAAAAAADGDFLIRLFPE